jgi:predicted transcriptional regulator
MSDSFSDQLRQAVRESKMSRYAISKQTGIAQSTLSKFIGGSRGLSLESVDKLMDALRLEITTSTRKDD